MAPSDERLRGLDHQKRLFGCFGNLLDDGPQEKRVWLGGRVGADDHKIMSRSLLKDRLLRIPLHGDDALHPRLEPQPLNKSAIKDLLDLRRRQLLLAVKNGYFPFKRASKLSGNLKRELRIGATAHGHENALAIGQIAGARYDQIAGRLFYEPIDGAAE